MLGINQLLCLPKAELKTKNSTKRQLAFGFQLDIPEKNLITLTRVTFTKVMNIRSYLLEFKVFSFWVILLIYDNLLIYLNIVAI